MLPEVKFLSRMVTQSWTRNAFITSQDVHESMCVASSSLEEWQDKNQNSEMSNRKIGDLPYGVLLKTIVTENVKV